MNIYIDSPMKDEQRRRELYNGAIFAHRPSDASLRLCRLAQELIVEAFAPLDPLRIHESISAQSCAQVLADLKPRFIHHPLAKECIRELLLEAGCDPEKTYFDVPRMRTAFPGDYLKSGIAYAFHLHRDTWYSAPLCQINWWMPIFDVNSENCMALHPAYWARPVKNGSRNYNYHKWNEESRHNAAQHVKSDTRVQPHAEEELRLDPQIRLVCPVGGAYQFSAAQMHSTVPNTSAVVRYSIDFRTVHLDDVRARVGAENVDSACTGTTIGDYLNVNDLSHIPDQVMDLYRDGTERQYAGHASGDSTVPASASAR